MGPPAPVPALFVHGELSTYVTDAGIEAARLLFPNASFVCLAGTGHWLHAEKPEAFNAAVLDFLRGDGREGQQ